MVGKEGGKAKPLKAPKKGPKEYDDDELAFLAKKKEEEKALKALKEKAKTGSVGGAGLKSLERSNGNDSGCRLCMLLKDAVNAALRPNQAQSAAAAGSQQQQAQGTAAHQEKGPQSEIMQDASPHPAEDCMGCRLTGLMLGLGGAGYVSSRLLDKPYPTGAHRYTLIGVSAGLFALGVGRAIGF